MPRVSVTGAYVEKGISDAVEWIIGDADTSPPPSTYYQDQENTVPRDLTGATIAAKVEFYFARVSASRSGSEAELSVSGLVLDDTRAVRSITCPVTNAAMGQFQFPIPADLYPGEQPKADEAGMVPVGVVYLTRTQDTETETDRFLMIFRRGSP